MSENEIILPSDLNLEGATDLAAVEAVSQSSSFLPRLQLCGSQSELAKEQKIAIAHFALVYSKDRFDDLGKEVNFLAIAVRAKAMRIDGDSVLSYFKMSDPEFKKIQIDSERPNSGCMYGPEYFIWIPSVEKLATFYFGSTSARRESAPLLDLMKQGDGKLKPAAATTKAKFIKTPRFSWHAPQILPCTTPLTVPPPEAELREQLAKFLNPSESKVETVQETADRPR